MSFKNVFRITSSRRLSLMLANSLLFSRFDVTVGIMKMEVGIVGYVDENK